MAVARSEVTAPGPFSGGFPALRNPLLLVPALIGLSSVGTLLLYFFGVAELSYTVRLVLVPATLLLVALTVWARRTGRDELYDRITAGLNAAPATARIVERIAPLLGVLPRRMEAPTLEPARFDASPGAQ